MATSNTALIARPRIERPPDRCYLRTVRGAGITAFDQWPRPVGRICGCGTMRLLVTFCTVAFNRVPAVSGDAMAAIMARAMSVRSMATLLEKFGSDRSER